MICNCKDETEKQLLELFKAETPNGTDHRVSLSGYALALDGNKLTLRGVIEATQEVKRTSKAGIHTKKRTKLSVMFSYCPFCGKPATEQTEPAADGVPA